MVSVWERLREALYFYRRHALSLLALALPIVLPVVLAKNYRQFVVLHNDDKALSQDVLLLLLQMLASWYAVACTLLYTVSEVDGRRPGFLTLQLRALLALPALSAFYVLVGLACFALPLLLLSAGLALPAVLLSLPGIWLSGSLMPGAVYVVVERQSVPEALRNSFVGFREQALQVLLSQPLAMAPVMVPAVALAVFAGKLPIMQQLAANVLIDMLLLLGSQFAAVVLVRYYDMRRETQR